MVKNSGLSCQFIISQYPQGAPVSERTLPLAIFKADPKICYAFLRKWTKNNNIRAGEIDIREVGLSATQLSHIFDNVKWIRLIDWPYYLERLGACIQKIVTIPAALQGLSNPVPRVPHPPWLENKRKEKMESHLQHKITDMFKSKPKEEETRTRVPSSGETIVVIDIDEEVPNPAEQDPPVLSDISTNIEQLQSTHRLGPHKPGPGKVKATTGDRCEAMPEKKTWARDGFDEWVCVRDRGLLDSCRK